MHNFTLLYLLYRLRYSLNYTNFTCRAAQRLELQGIQAYSSLEGMQQLHTLPTAIVDYRGIRLSAQGLAPGLEGSDQDAEASPASRYTLEMTYCGVA